MDLLDHTFRLGTIDYLSFALYFVFLSLIGFWAGRKKKTGAEDYFLAGKTLPWYVVGTSFVASNIHAEHFIGMVGTAIIYGICVAVFEWWNVTYSLLIWFFIPFLIASRVFTIPEFLERRYNGTVRLFFASVTIICNVVAFLAAVLYGGGLALNKIFGWDLWFAIVALGLFAGSWAIYGGLKSVAWTDFYTIIIMIVGGIMVTLLGLEALSGDERSVIEGFRVMIERNQAKAGVWKEVVQQNAQRLARVDEYNRLSLLQPITHEVCPWVQVAFGFLSMGIWYSVLNQFMIQRVLGAKNMYHARMGIVFATHIKMLMPLIVVLPGLILFAQNPEILKLPEDEMRPAADRGYIHMIQTLIPMGLRGLFLAALFGAIQSTINSVVNSTATVFTLDIYKKYFKPDLDGRQIVRVGMIVSICVLLIAIALGGYISQMKGSLFIYIQSLYAFFAPPFSAIFLLGLLSRRVNGFGAAVTVIAGFIVGTLFYLYVTYVDNHVLWLEPYLVRSVVTWAFCAVTCVTASRFRPAPTPEKVSDDLTFNFKKLNVFSDLGDRWYKHVLLWWGLFVVVVLTLLYFFSPAHFR